MARFLIEAPHTVEECLRALDEVLQQSEYLMMKHDWGCAAGVHTGWAVVEAEDEAEARRFIPTFLRAKSRVIRLNKFTAGQVRALHEQMAAQS
jgi:hypothetical protein